MRYFLAALLTLALLCSAALAQDGPDYALWDSVASRAEKAVDEADGSNAVFETLRARIVGFRSEFQTARQNGSERIATLRAQIEALGAEPETGAEPTNVANQRAALNAQLRNLTAPQQVADAAFQRADGLINQIDQIIRARQTKRLLSLGPSPLNPAHWPRALEDAGRILADIGQEAGGWTGALRRPEVRDNLPLVVGLLALAGVLLGRGRRWTDLVSQRLKRLGGSGAGVSRFAVSLFRIILPLAGVYALAAALRATGFAGVRINLLLDAVPIWATILLGAGWIAERLFPRDDPDDALIALTPDHQTEARFYFHILALLVVLKEAVELLLGLEPTAVATPAVLSLPIIGLLGLVMFRLGLIMRSPADTAAAGGARVLWGLGTIATGIAIVAPTMTAIGYSEAANALMYPAIYSLGIFSFVVVLQRFAADVYGMITGQGALAREALIPILTGFVLVLAAAPFLALAWGARTVDLWDVWARFSQGFQIGETRISPSDFLTFALIFVVGYSLTRLLQSTLRSNVLPKTRIDLGGQNAIVSGIGYIGVFLAAIIAVTGAGIDLSSLALVAGALSVGIGFGLQNIVSNFVSGIILLIERPISEGDWIEVGGQQGYVRDISVRSTRIETFERTDVIVPNADLVSGTVTNFTRGNTIGRLIVDIGVAYGTDTRKVNDILQEIANAQPMVLADPPPSVLFNAFGADALEFQIRMILRDVNYILTVKNDINHAIAERFAAEGIEVPFAQRDIWLRNPESLKQG